MTKSIFWRIVWKEYRTQRAFWFGVLGLGLVICWLNSFTSRDAGIALVLPILYILGSASMLFAGEQEEGTDLLLANWAVAPWPLAMAKLSFLFVSGLLIFLLLTICAGILRLHSEHQSIIAAMVVGNYGFSPLAMIAWSLFWSLLLRRPLLVIVLALITSMGANYAVSFLLQIFNVLRHENSVQSAMMLDGVSGQLAIFGLLILAVDLWLVSRWARHRPVSVIWTTTAAEVMPVPALSQASRRVMRTPTLVGCLLWQEARHAWWPIALFTGTLALSIVFLVFFARERILPSFAILSCLSMGPTLFGVFAFRGEQEGERFRFLSDRGVSPLTVWLTKHTIWITALVLGSLITLGLYFGVSIVSPQWGHALPDLRNVTTGLTMLFGHYSIFVTEASEVAAFGFLILILSYSCGQFTSMFLAKSVSAFFVGVILSMLSIGFTTIMFMLRVPLLWSCLPIGLVLMFSTMIRSRDWMLQRWGLRRWRLPFALALVAMFITGTTFWIHRVSEIPTDLAPSPIAVAAKAPTEEDVQTGDMLLQAAALIEARAMKTRIADPNNNELSALHGWQHALPSEKDMLANGTEALNLALKASQRSGCSVRRKSKDGEYFEVAGPVFYIARLLNLSARKLESEGKLDEAWAQYSAGLRIAHLVASEGYFQTWYVGEGMQSTIASYLPRWAAAKGQTHDRITRALSEYEASIRTFPLLYNSAARERDSREAILNGDWAEDLWGNSPPPFFARLGFRIAKLLPGEKTRARQLANYWSSYEISNSLQAELGILRDDTSTASVAELKQISNWPLEKAREWNQNTILGGTAFSPQHSIRMDYFRFGMISLSRRSTRLQLAIYAYRAKHGHIPESLDALVGEYFKRLPLDPWSGQEFGYRAHGFPQALEFAGSSRGQVVAAGTPVLWSAGLNHESIVPYAESIGAPMKYVRTVGSNTGIIPAVGGIASNMRAYIIE